MPLIPRNITDGEVRDLQDYPAKAETKFKEIVLKVAEQILPEKNGVAKDANKEASVEKTAEAIENESGRILNSLSKDFEGKSELSLKAIVQGPAAPKIMSLEKSEQVTEIKELPNSQSLLGKSQGKGQNLTTAILGNQTIVPLPGAGTQQINVPGHSNLLAVSNALLVPIQTSLTREGVHAVALANPEHIDHALHQHGMKHNEITTPIPTPSVNDIQGLTIALTLPLGLIPVTPTQLINDTEAARGAQEDLSIGSVMHRSLHSGNSSLPTFTDNTALGIPSDKPNLFPIPDGREITFINQMAQMGLFRGKKVEDSKFRMSDGLQLDPGYRFGDLLAIVYLAALCGASSLTQIGAFVEEHEAWLGRYFDLRRGAPAPLVFMWLFTRITPYYFTKIILQHVDAIIDRKHGRRSPLNSIRIWETNSGLIFGQSKAENRAPSQSQFIPIFDWEDATLILEPASEPEEVRKNTQCRLLMSVDAGVRDQLLQGLTPITSKSQEWNDEYDVISNLELTLYPNWTVGQYTKTQEGILKINRSFFSNLPLDFNAWNTLFYDRTDVEAQTHWTVEGRFLSFGDVVVSHAMDNFELLLQIAHKALIASTSLSGSIEQKRLKLWEDPDELMILLGY
jgi:hypothetical protein